MNKTERLILNNQATILLALATGRKDLQTQTSIARRMEVTRKALAPQSDEVGYEKDIEETGGLN